MKKIESITATIPVSGQSYTDLRPTISADSVEEYREALAEVGKMAGNSAFTQRMEGSSMVGGRKLKTMKYGDTTLLFDEERHTYYNEEGVQYVSGSAFADRFFEPFKEELIAKKVNPEDPEKVIEGWTAKGEVSKNLGTTIHLAIETMFKHGEKPNNPWLREITEAYCELFKDREVYPEQFVICPEMLGCGVIDTMVRGKGKEVELWDIKTYADPFKKMALTEEAKKLWPKLKGEAISQGFIQLNFYRMLLECNGYKVTKMVIAVLNNNQWVEHTCPKLDLSKAL